MEAYSIKNPYSAEIVGVRRLTRPGSPKETIHVDISLGDSGLEYVAGDALGVIPQNDPALVDAFLAEMRLDGAEMVNVAEDSKLSLRDALITSRDITGLKKSTLQKWNLRAESAILEGIMAEKDLLQEFLWGRDLLDVARDTMTRADYSSGDELVALLPKLAPRLYSIASSPDHVPGQVSLCVGVVRYYYLEREKNGVCSTYLADRVKPGDKVRVFVHSNKGFRLPEDGNTPIIMVGPGTGIAPFRAFWQQRIHDHATGGMWLFYGNPHRATDGCYADELAPLVDSGVLKLSTAWSRDQAYKIYVQNIMDEAGAEIWQWLQRGAVVYVCGDAKRMAKDVEQALLRIITREGHYSEEQAAAYLAEMRVNKRYQRDIY